MMAEAAWHSFCSFAPRCERRTSARSILKNGVPPIGPFSPGVFAGDYLYVSGQGAKRPDGVMPATFPEQVRQTLENVKAVVEGAD